MANDPAQADGRRPRSSDGEAANLVIEQATGRPLAGVDTDVLDPSPPRANRPIKKVGFIVNDTIEAAKVEAPRIAQLLHERGVEVTESHSASPDTTVNWTKDDLLDMIFTFGGDGTILRAARIAAPLGVPLMGVNLGRVGFLTEMNPWQVQERIDLFREGKYWLERRAMLRAVLLRDSTEVGSFVALNDVVASRAALSRVVHCTLSANGHKVTTYVADGVIVATPTGSTAYSMAAGGPIMHPELRSIIVTPIAPYLTIVKSLVLPDDNVLDLHIDTDDEAFLTVDGQTHVPLRDGDTVRVTISPDPCLFARVQDKAYFSATLVNRLRRAE
ncbi:MAG TPA: NAD(+)/NADH kinase [Chloroflexia bacterium]|jgi:NAD+ kinase